MRKPRQEKSEVIQARSVYAALKRQREEGDPQLLAAREVMDEVSLINAVQKALAKSPPLTPERRERIIALLG